VKRFVPDPCGVVIAVADPTDAAQGRRQGLLRSARCNVSPLCPKAQASVSTVEASVALDDCGKGNTATAIPVLEKKLRESGFSLPEEFKP